MSALVYTCPKCRTIVDYSCMCKEPPSISELAGHDTVDAAKAHVEKTNKPEVA